MKLHTVIEMYLKYDNMHINGTLNAFICINNHVNSCINCMLSRLTHDLSIWGRVYIMIIERTVIRNL